MRFSTLVGALPSRRPKRFDCGRCLLLFVLLASYPLPAASAPPTTTERLQNLAQRMTFDWAKSHPLAATSLGLSDEDGQLNTPSEAENARDLATVRGWESELASIPLEGAPLVDVDDAKLLRAQLVAYERQYLVYKTYEKDPSGPSMAIVSAIYTQFLHLPIAGTEGATQADVAGAWEKIIARLAGAPAYIAAGNALVTHPGHLYGVTGAEQLAGAPNFLNGALTDAAKEQLPADRFAAFAKARDATLAAIAQTKKYIDEHAASWPENYAMGRAAYDAMLRDEELLPFNSDDIERMARDELAHGWAVQIWMEDLAAERGTPIGPKTGGGLAPGGAALIDYYRARIAHLQEFVTQHQVVDVPAWLGKMDIVETPKFLQPVSPGASMNRAACCSARAPPAFTSLRLRRRLRRRRRVWMPIRTSTATASSRRGRTKRCRATFSSCPSPAATRTLSAKSKAVVNSRKAGRFTAKNSSCNSAFSATISMRATSRRSGNACAAPEPSSIPSWQAALGPSIKRFNSSRHQTGFSPEQAKAAIASIALEPGYVIAYTSGRAQLEALLAEYWARAGASLRDFHDRLLCYGSTATAAELQNGLASQGQCRQPRSAP